MSVTMETRARILPSVILESFWITGSGMRNIGTSPWTDKRVEELKRMWFGGESCSVIANALGGGLTRNAVIGKIHRLGLTETQGGRPKSSKATLGNVGVPKPKRAYTRRQRTHWSPRPETIPSEPEEFVEDAMADQDIPIEQRKTLLQLTSETCRWPVGDPGAADFFFCGALPEIGQPYCSAHCARAFSATPRLNISLAERVRRRRQGRANFAKRDEGEAA